MRMVRARSLDRNVSVLGFGCASLGSRISAATGRRALDKAFDLGVSWFDVAPPYGDGQAEFLLGQFLKGRRDKVVVCTKCGISLPRVSLPRRLLRPIARNIVAALPRLREMVKQRRPAEGRTPLDPFQIEASLVASLRRLRTDHVDVLALHEPTEEEAADGRSFEELETLVRRGMVVLSRSAALLQALPQRLKPAARWPSPNFRIILFCALPGTCEIGCTQRNWVWSRTAYFLPTPSFFLRGRCGIGGADCRNSHQSTTWAPNPSSAIF
jgi:aryl-alcohol dehydrogenase-like predicted oxidoreductase